MHKSSSSIALPYGNVSPEPNVPSSFSSTPKMTPVKTTSCYREKKSLRSLVLKSSPIKKEEIGTEKANRKLLEFCKIFLHFSSSSTYRQDLNTFTFELLLSILTGA